MQRTVPKTLILGLALAAWPTASWAGGWYLLLAPEHLVPVTESLREDLAVASGEDPPLRMVPDPTAPMSTWTRHSAHDSAKECEAARLRVFQARKVEAARDRKSWDGFICWAVGRARAYLAVKLDPQKRAEMRKFLDELKLDRQKRAELSKALDPAEPDPEVRVELRKIIDAMGSRQCPEPPPIVTLPLTVAELAAMRDAMELLEVDPLEERMRWASQCVATDDPRLR